MNNSVKPRTFGASTPPRVMMLGWEYPPHIAGGLGTACHGLTRALALHHVPITFVIPVARGGEPAEHLTLISALCSQEPTSEPDQSQASINDELNDKPIFNVVRLPSLLQPYWQPKDYPRDKIFATSKGSLNASKDPDATHHYANDLISEVDRFTQLAVKAALCHEFDIIHAHDWMTFKAGVILTEITGKPLVVHVHSLEYDRCGTNGFGFIHERERLGILAADAIIAVSGYTKSIILQEHPVDESKIYVVHNGVTAIPSVLNNMVFDSSNNQSLNSVSVSPTGTSNTSSPNQKRVLFFGRITLQKGPEYFVEAARNVVSIVPNVLFVMAGQGDMRSQLMARVEELGLGQNFSFPGFLRGAELDRELSLADLYIMPSKSEPFGISALEAIQRSIPVLLSRQSGVREVILNALSFDFWDTRRLSDLIINCLEYPELGNEMASQAAEELKILQWEEAARKTCEIYQQLLGEAFLPTDEPYFPPSLVDDLEIESSVLESSYYSTAEKTSQHKRIEQTLRLS